MAGEPEVATTAESLDAAAETMHRMGLDSCIVVSDGYHIHRLKRLLEAQGIMYFRQAAGFVLWQKGSIFNAELKLRAG